MSRAPTPPPAFSVAPVPIWRLLWLWVPMAGAMAVVTVTTLQSSQRSPLELGYTLPFVLLVTGVLTWAFFRRRISLEGDDLVVVSTFYRRRVPVALLQLDKARIVDLAEHHEFKPSHKINGYAMPGFQSGHYRLGGRKAFCLITDASRMLYLPLRDDSVLLLSPEQPRALLEALQALAVPARAH
ncbi:PH domain-containing protein [Stenotrophomonas sp. PD6]|uniref:PH domain-containing protein n=1 Tax=Stenotrophomonas sp. PD6 TaxID=3368612 RepID=UPI003BA2C046